ncbi:MAG TPA: hypothetical protein VF042_15010, partial [Gemmatimonadaceae bacterium]
SSSCSFMLLAKEAHPIEYLPRTLASGFEPAFQIRIFSFEPFNPFRCNPRRSRRPLERFHARLSLKSATAECRELVAKVTYKLLELSKCFQIRTIAV